MNKKLIVVADAHKAHMIEGKGIRLHKIVEKFENTHLDKKMPDPKHNSRTGFGHFYDPQNTKKELECYSFAADIANAVHASVMHERYSSVILVAPPKMLGAIRKKMNGHCSIEKSLSIEATNLQIHELEKKVFN